MEESFYVFGRTVGFDGETPPTPVWPEMFHATMQQNRDGALAHVDLYYDWQKGRNMNIIDDGNTVLYDNERNNGSTYYYYPEKDTSRQTNNKSKKDQMNIDSFGEENLLLEKDEENVTSISIKKKTLRTLQISEKNVGQYDKRKQKVTSEKDDTINPSLRSRITTLQNTLFNADENEEKREFLNGNGDDTQCKVMKSGVGILTPDWLKGARYLGTQKVTTLNRGDVMADVFSKNGAGHFPFVTYYNDIEQNIPVRWVFFDNATFDVLTWTENENLSEAEWQIPGDCFSI